jgi:hypothetical protein
MGKTLKIIYELYMATHAYNLDTLAGWGRRLTNLRPAWATQQDHVSKNK